MCSGAGTSGDKLLSLLSTKNKRRYSEYTRRVFGCGDERREATFFTVHQKQEKIQRIHAPCIRVRGRSERSYFLYCPPKTREDTANTRTVYSGAGTSGEKLLSLLSTIPARKDQKCCGYTSQFLRMLRPQESKVLRGSKVLLDPKKGQHTQNLRASSSTSQKL